MKRKIFNCFLVLLVITASIGCADRPRAEKLFYYRDRELTAYIDMECNGSPSSFELTKGVKGDITLDFTAPEELCGFRLSLCDGSATVSVDGLTAEAPTALALLPDICGKIFTLSPDEIVRVETVNENSEHLTRVNCGEMVITLDAGGVPVGADGVFRGAVFRANISDLAVKTQ